MHLPRTARTLRWSRTGRLFAIARLDRPVLPHLRTGLRPRGGAEVLRASLVSATSLLALLLLDGREAGADPVISVATPVPFFTMSGGQEDAGIEAGGIGAAGGPNVIQSYLFTPLSSGAAATADAYTGFTPYFQAVQSTASNQVGVDAADSDLPALRRSPSPGRAAAASNSVFVGTGAGRALLDSSAGMAASGSASFSYTIPATTGRSDDASMPPAYGDDPTRRDGPPAASGADPGAGLSPPASHGEAAPFGGLNAPPASGRDSAASAGTVAVPKTGADGGRFLPGLGVGASVFDAAAADQAGGPASARTPRSAIREEVARALYLGVRPEPAGAPVIGLRMAMPDPSRFTVASAPGDSTVNVPIPVVGTGAGELSSSLTIFTAAAARLNDGDDSFAFFFDPGILQ
jgi:hypothetical protein